MTMDGIFGLNYLVIPLMFEPNLTKNHENEMEFWQRNNILICSFSEIYLKLASKCILE